MLGMLWIYSYNKPAYFEIKYHNLFWEKLELCGSTFLIFLGLNLTYLQTYLETISAILDAGVLFFQI